MRPGLTSRVDIAIGVVIVLVCPAVATLAVWAGTKPTFAVAALLALIAGIYIGIRHPLWLYWLLAVALGALPLGYFPGVHLPLTLGFGAAVLLASLIHPTEVNTISSLEVAMLLLILASALSVAVTGSNLVDYGEFAKWTISSLLVVALLRLSRENLATFGRVYVYAAGVSAVFALMIYAVDSSGKMLRVLRIFGYGLGDSQRYFYGANGVSLRLAGTYIDPNAAGIALVVALVLTMVLLRGPLRPMMSALFLVTILLTLSRSAIFSVLGGLLLVFLFHSLRRRDRQILIGTLVVIAVGGFATPQIRARVLQSFGSSDVGSSARGDALREFPHHMAGSWWFGLGWGRPEFKSGATGFAVNTVANAPLLTVYRGGIITGVMFVMLLLVGCVMAYRALRSSNLTNAAYGGVFIGFCLIALQLDFPVVTIPSVTMMFSVFLVFLVYVDTSRHPAAPNEAAKLPGTSPASHPAPNSA